MGKYKKFLYVFVVIFTFIFMPNVKAETAENTWYWGSNEMIEHPISYGGYRSSASGSSQVTVDTVDLVDANGNFTNDIIYVSPSLSTSYSYLSVFTLDEQAIRKGHMYSFKGYMCTMTNPPILNGMYIGSGANIQSSIANMSSYFDYNTELSGYPGINPNSSAYVDENLKCRMITKIFVANVNSNLFGIKVHAQQTTKFYFIGYSLENLGATDYLTESQLTNVINSSGLASASSVDEVQKSVDEVQSQLTEVNSSIDQQTQQQQQNHQETMDTITSNDSSDATNDAGNFFSGFQTDTFGLTSIITAPLNLIRSITSSTCSTMPLLIPFVDNMTLNLPCLRGIYEQHFGSFLTIYQTITFGIVAYWVCVRIFALVKDFKNPEHDEIEVLDL